MKKLVQTIFFIAFLALAVYAVHQIIIADNIIIAMLSIFMLICGLCGMTDSLK